VVVRSAVPVHGADGQRTRAPLDPKIRLGVLSVLTGFFVGERCTRIAGCANEKAGAGGLGLRRAGAVPGCLLWRPEGLTRLRRRGAGESWWTNADAAVVAPIRDDRRRPAARHGSSCWLVGRLSGALNRGVARSLRAPAPGGGGRGRAERLAMPPWPDHGGTGLLDSWTARPRWRAFMDGCALKSRDRRRAACLCHGSASKPVPQ